jgi:hypothetical protein
LALFIVPSVPVAAVIAGRGGAQLPHQEAGSENAEHHHIANRGQGSDPEVIIADLEHHGRRVMLRRRGNEVIMNLDGRDLPHHDFARVGSGYGSHLLAFREDRNPVDLAMALVDGDGLLYVL